MQIHEITKINEAVYSGPSVKAQPGAKTSPIAGALKKAGSAYQSVKGGVQGAVQGYQQAKTDRLTTQATTDLTNKAAQVWNQYAKNLKANTPDPQRYTELYKQALTAFTQKNLLKNQAIKNSINQQEITQLVDAITAAKDNPQQVTQLIGKLVQQAALSRPDVDSQAAQQNIEVIRYDE